MPLFNILIFNKIIFIVSDAIATYCRKWQRQGKFELTIIDKTLKIEFSLSIIELEFPTWKFTTKLDSL